MDSSTPTVGERVLLASGVALIVCSFLPWFGPGRFSGGPTTNGWEFPLLGIVPTQIAFGLVVVVALRRFAGAPLLDLGPKMHWGDLYLAAASLACVLVLAKVLGGDSVQGFAYVRKYGLILAGVASVGLVIGGFLCMREDRPKTAEPPDDADAPTDRGDAADGDAADGI